MLLLNRYLSLSQWGRQMSIQQKAVELFGGKDQLVQDIILHIQRATGFPLAVDQVQGFTRQQLLDRFTRHDLAIDQVMPIKLSDAQRVEFLEALALGDSGGVGASGKPAPTELLLETHIRWEALTMICTEGNHDSDSGRKTKMQEYRNKYNAALS